MARILTKHEFEEELSELKERNWKVKHLIDKAGSFEKCSDHVQDMILDRMNVEKVTRYKKAGGDQ